MNNTISSRMSRIPIYVMLGVAVVCLAASFDHLSSVLKTFGYSDIVAYPLAVAIDLYILSMLFLCWQRTHWMLQALLALGIIASGSANFFAGMEHGWFSAVYSLVPIVLIKAVYLALWSISKNSHSVTPTIATPPQSVPIHASGLSGSQTFEEITAEIESEWGNSRPSPSDLADEDIRDRIIELDSEIKERARQYFRDNPDATERDIAKRFRRADKWARARMSEASTTQP